MNEVAQATREIVRPGTVYGIATLILGGLCVLAPFISGIGVTLLVGLFLLAAGIARLFFAFKAGSFGKGLLTFLLGGLSIVCGLVFFARPLLGLASLTVVLVAFFIVDGIVEIVAAFKIKPLKGWGRMLLGGIISILLAILIAYEWPVSGAYAIGILVGIRLLVAGWSMIGVVVTAEDLADDVEGATT